MTVEELVVQALARAMQFTDDVPTTRSVHYRRVGVMQQQLYARAARVNPDYSGVCAVGALAAMALDLSDLINSVEAAESVTRVLIEDPGTSTYAAGDEVTVVPSTDSAAALAPRATIRNRVLRGVGSDLDGVVSLEVQYPRVPVAVVPTDENRLIDVPDPHSELLVVALALACLKQVASTQSGAANAQGGITLLSAEHDALLGAWDAHVRGYAGALVSRFGSPPRAFPTSAP